jgi:hypothetical protein
MNRQGSRIRVVHNVANGPEVDVYVDGAKVLASVPYSAMSPYLLVESGRHLVEAKIADTDDLVKAVEIVLDPETSYTAIVHGDITDLKSIDVLALGDNLACPAMGNAHLRFIHAAATVPAVDIYANGMLLFEDVAYGETGMPMYLPVPADTYDIEVKVAGTDTTALELPATMLDEKKIYTVIASGLVGDDDAPLKAIVSEDSNGMCVSAY